MHSDLTSTKPIPWTDASTCKKEPRLNFALLFELKPMLLPYIKNKTHLATDVIYIYVYYLKQLKADSSLLCMHVRIMGIR